jgi:spore maturation protein CgeB
MLVGVFNDKSTNSWQAKGFENLGFDIVRYNYRVQAEILGRKKRDDEIIEICKRECPDFILYSKCNLVDIRVVRECNKICKTVLWYMDFMPRIDNELRQKMTECNYVFCSRYDGINEALKHNKNVYRLQCSYDPSQHYFIDIPQVRDVVFIGDIERRGRREYVKEVKFSVVNNAYGIDHSRVVSESKINLNFSEGDGTSNRLYKLLASKGFVLTQPWIKMEEDWDVGRDFVVFTSPADLQEKINYYLSRPLERNVIAEHGHNRVKSYDNTNYAKNIIKEVLDK